MTTSDRMAFYGLYEGLCRAFDKKPNAETGNAYFDALMDYPLELLEHAKADLIRSRKFWPKPVDWRQACDAARAGKVRYVPPKLVTHQDGTTERSYCCARCQDTGWAPACGCLFGDMLFDGTCPQHPRIVHDMPYRQAVTACACRESNPAWQASRPMVSGSAREAGGGRE